MAPRRILINCDDMGMHPSVNRAIAELLRQGPICSVSLMPTGRYFADAVERLKAIGVRTVGVHLALSSEYAALPLIPVSPSPSIPSLLVHGRFVPNFADVANHVSLREAEAELRAQIERTVAAGFHLSHLDGHMFFHHPEEGSRAVYDLVCRLAGDYAIPLRGGPGWREEIPATMIWDEYKSTTARHEFYDRYLGEGPPLAELILHPADNADELLPFTKAGERRTADYSYFSHPTWRQSLAARGVQIVGWSDITSYGGPLAPPETNGDPPLRGVWPLRR